jgi:hypothetical protein
VENPAAAPDGLSFTIVINEECVLSIHYFDHAGIEPDWRIQIIQGEGGTPGHVAATRVETMTMQEHTSEMTQERKTA